MPSPSLSYCKLCELEDFRDPDLRSLMRDMAGVGPERPNYPDGEEHRKPWEVAMSARALRDFGALRDGAGPEPRRRSSGSLGTSSASLPPICI
jgi:hypothetical protein